MYLMPNNRHISRNLSLCNVYEKLIHVHFLCNLFQHQRSRSYIAIKKTNLVSPLKNKKKEKKKKLTCVWIYEKVKI